MTETYWLDHYQQQSRAHVRVDAASPLTNEENAFIEWSDRCDAGDQARDEKGQFAAGTGGASARASAKEAVGHVQALRAIIAKSASRTPNTGELRPPNPAHAAALAHAEKAAKNARGSARKAEAEPNSAASNAHAAKAAVHAQTAKTALNQVHGIADKTIPTPIVQGGKPVGVKGGVQFKSKMDLAKESSDKAQSASNAAGRNPGRETHQAAATANKEAAAQAKGVGDKGGAEFHTQAFNKHEALTKAYTPGVVVERGANPHAPSAADNAKHAQNKSSDHQAMDREKAQMQAEADKRTADKVHTMGVDDYEHSGDTEHYADHIHSIGGRNVTPHDDRDEDGEARGYVKFQLPKGVSKEHFNKLMESTWNGEQKSNPHLQKAIDSAKYEGGKNIGQHLANADSHDAAKAAAERATRDNYRPKSEAAQRSQEAHDATAHAAAQGTASRRVQAQAHSNAANAHALAASAHRSAGGAGHDKAAEHESLANHHDARARMLG